MLMLFQYGRLIMEMFDSVTNLKVVLCIVIPKGLDFKNYVKACTVDGSSGKSF